jgi:two-component system nitrogen regulation response regulator NtrX
MKPLVLVVDDEAGVRGSLAGILGDEGYQVEAVGSGEAALRALEARRFDLVLLDVWLPGQDGLEVLSRIRECYAELPVVVISGHGTIETAVKAVRLGAQDFVEKPLSLEKTLVAVRNALRQQRLESELRQLRERLDERYVMIGESAAVERLRAEIAQAAPSNGRVLIYGENGTGKELVARQVHAQSHRARGPFVEVNCAAIPEELIESELFGHARGAFTGALAARKGKFELADGGTLFLDEIGDVSPKLQVDLLRVLQERRFFRVGGTSEIAVDVRVVAATHRDLAAEARAGRFREDLFYRLNVIAIRIPPLRERLEDVPLLAQEFLDRLAHELGREVTGISEEALRLLLDHPWPGNVRELENAIERALVTCKTGVLSAESFAFLTRPAAEGSALPPGLTLQEVEKRYVAETLSRLSGNVKAAAESLGIDRSTLYEKIKRYEIAR